MGQLVLAPAALMAVTNDQGKADIAVKVPGIFSGVDGYVDNLPKNGRYIRQAEIFAQNPEAGDYVTELQVEDRDNLIPEALRAKFPNYPVIFKFSDPDVVETENLKSGVYLPLNGRQTIAATNRDQFLPSGLYLCGTFTAANPVAGRKVFINYIWNRWID